MRWTGQIFWLLAYNACAAPHLLPAFTVLLWRQPYRLHIQGIAGGTPATTTIGPWEVVSSYSSATAPDLHGISCADPLFQARKELDPKVAACASSVKIILIACGYDRFSTNALAAIIVASNQSSIFCGWPSNVLSISLRKWKMCILVGAQASHISPSVLMPHAGTSSGCHRRSSENYPF
jgi:hypothetical protein